MVRADAGGDGELELLGLGEPLLGEISRPERLRDHDLGVGQLLLERRIGTVLVGGHHQGMARVLEEFAKTELAGDAAKQLARLEVDLARSRRRHAAGIVVDLGDVVAGVFLRIAGRRDRRRERRELLPCYTPSSGATRRTMLIAARGRARNQQRPGAMSLLHRIKASRGTRIPPRPHVSSCRPARMFALLSGLPTVGTFASGLKRDQVATP